MIFSFPQLKRHEKKKFSSRVFHIITAYVKDKPSLSLFDKVDKPLFHNLAIKNYFNDLPHSKPFWKLDIKI